MRILAIDTAMQSCGVAVVSDGKALSAVVRPMERGHAEALAPMVVEALDAAGVRVADLDRVAVTIGPGTFTGVRVGLAFARAVVLGRAIPVIGVTTLEALAAAAPANGPIAAVIDARRGQVYAQAFAAPGGAALCEPIVDTPASAAKRIGEMSDSPALVGSGAALVGAHLQDFDDLGSAQPDPVVVAAVAAKRPAPDTPPGALYLRPPDAKPSSRPGIRPAAS